MEIQEIKDTMDKFYNAQKASTEVAQLRRKLVVMLKKSDLTKAKFNFSDRTIQYSSYSSFEDITQKQIRQVINQYYPQISADNFVKQVYEARGKKIVETLKVTNKKSSE